MFESVLENTQDECRHIFCPCIHPFRSVQFSLGLRFICVEKQLEFHPALNSIFNLRKYFLRSCCMLLLCYHIFLSGRFSKPQIPSTISLEVNGWLGTLLCCIRT